jgi:hypothetical protein
MTTSRADSSEALRELEAALDDVTAAEHALEAALCELRVGIRAEKVKVTEAVEIAFSRLRTTRSALASLRERIGGAPAAPSGDGERR